MSKEAVRDQVIDRIHQDLVGPLSGDEVLGSNPTDIYLTGILFPAGSVIQQDEDDELGTEGGDDSADGTVDEGVSLVNQRKPSTMGVSFAVEVDGSEEPSLNIRVGGAHYHAFQEDDAGEGEDEAGQWRTRWRRDAVEVELDAVRPLGTDLVDLTDHGLDGISIHIRTAKWEDKYLVTLALSNNRRIESGSPRSEWESSCLFQSCLSVRAAVDQTRFVPRPAWKPAQDEDAKVANLIYRNAKQYAAGHTCSAEWVLNDSGSVEEIRTVWLPTATVPAMDPMGHPHIHEKVREEGGSLKAENLGQMEESNVSRTLTALVQGFRDWIAGQDGIVPSLPGDHADQARKHLARCGAIADRMQQSVDFLKHDADAMKAFRLANTAMALQWKWSGERTELEWRPFQAGFILLALESVANGDSPERNVADLLWFPTGGGKTEAYLALVAFTVYFRRIRHGEAGAGVASLMRYTLRLLTTQQFERAARVICACEALRRGWGPVPNDLVETLARLGSEHISIGLWVGSASTPNNAEKAREVLNSRHGATPAQITHCPMHADSRVTWKASADGERIFCVCPNPDCLWHMDEEPLPVWTVDTDVYRERPSLLIGTVDKFAQIVRNRETRNLISADGAFRPPDLVIQDELHLISGPLGTLAGIYEAALDAIIGNLGRPPKVIASTATIRRAEEQILALFDRRTELFPAPGIDADDSGFAVVDREKPGRLYLGLTTVGRSAKFALQAVAASALQAAHAVEAGPAEKDPYWSLMAYFNSLRELGGALVLFQDDVNKTLEELAERRQEERRQSGTVREITSRVSSAELRQILDILERECDSGEAVDVALATNMISVGMDVSRLGLMIVNGQPKSMSEYIQATSRVGRGSVPGLVLTIYNSAKSRDRAHYENFASWHAALYREVEATSVTPFAPRARDRALHAAVVAIARHLIPELSESPRLTTESAQMLLTLSDFVYERARRVDSPEAQAVRDEIRRFVEDWQGRPALRSYWNDRQRNSSLLISAEKAAELGAAGRNVGEAKPTPNSMRNVEASVLYRMTERLRERRNG